MEQDGGDNFVSQWGRGQGIRDSIHAGKGDPQGRYEEWKGSGIQTERMRERAHVHSFPSPPLT